LSYGAKNANGNDAIQKLLRAKKHATIHAQTHAAAVSEASLGLSLLFGLCSESPQPNVSNGAKKLTAIGPSEPLSAKGDGTIHA
jgi:hypothetical protein